MTSPIRPNGSRFKLGDETFEIPLVGEFNVRNAAMAAIGGAILRRAEGENRQRAQEFFRNRAAAGSARRSARRKSDRRFRSSSDRDSHTPWRHCVIAIAGHRLWAIFEPRSNTTRRAVFQQQLPDALKLADGVFISQVARLEQIPEEERLNPKAVVDAIAKAGRPAFYEKNADAIVDRIVPMLRAKRCRRGFQQRRIR